MGEHNFSSHTFRLALIKANESGTYDEETDNFAALGSDAHSTTGQYSNAAGMALTNVAVSSLSDTDANDVAWIDFDDFSWTGTTIDASGALIYNDSHASDAAVCVLSFSGTMSSDNGTFAITIPTGAYNTAIIRIA